MVIEMAVKRYNYSISGGQNAFTRWLFISVAVHAAIVALLSIHPDAGKKVYTPVYEVELLPPMPPAMPDEVRHEEEPVPPKKTAAEVKKKRKERVARHKAHIKTVKGTARPDEAIARIREKVAVEDAVERIRKKVKGKEPSRSEVRVAARPPAKVYRYEELDAELRDYFDRISGLIRGSWSLPDLLRNKGYKTILSIHVRRDGTIESLWIEEGSGNKFYDESAVRAINKANPLPPLPGGWKGESIDLGFRF